ncbi:MAG TPA: amino acid adenylation domain-containing protein, partial [Longimicrobiaceae bacterium]|nr:amino acid adenylation domain-containing protein [Longimicrobiaceae bacterium]
VERHDWRGVPPGELEARAAELARRERRPFALDAAPLFRAACARTGERSHLGLFTFHHLVLDGWSSELAMREVFALYEAYSRGEAPALDPPRPFQAYVSWLQSQPPEGGEAFWREALAGVAAPAPLLPGPAAAGPPGVASAALPPALAARLQETARRGQLTLNTLFQGAWALLLGRLRGERDVVFGAVSAGRPPELPGADAMLGVFLGTVPVRAELPPGAAVGAWLRALQAAQLAARRHERHPLQRIAAWAGLPAGERLFDTLLAFQNLPFSGVGSARVGELEVRDLARLPAPTALGHALLLEVSVRGEVELNLGYDGSRCDAEGARRVLVWLRALLEQLADDPARRLAELSLASPAERRVLEAWSGSPAPGPARLVHELVAEQAARAPGAPALSHRGATLTYAELDRRANRLANHLRGRGVGPETRVGVCLERTPEMVVALLAVLKAGGAYVPLDPAYPPARLRAMVEDSGARLVLTTGALAGRLPEGAAGPVLLDALRERVAAESDAAPGSGVVPENLSHLIFTSGSTGRPRGVMIRHAAVSALLHWLREAVSGEELAPVLFSTSTGFDVSVAELFGTLAWGGKLVMVENALELATVDEPVAYASMVPSAAAELLRTGGIPRSVRTLNLGGEPLPPELARGLYALGTVERVGNLYGPTEDTTYSTYARVGREADAVTVGRPVAGARAYVLDAELQPLPAGAVGELYLAGEGLARGYAGRPDWTAERFLPCPFGPPGARMYRVRDRVRWTPEGELEYFGRTDFQVKLRGFRIELGEVEAALRAHPAVAEAVAVVREDAPGDRRLVAYLAAEDGAVPPAAELRARLAERLPEYMVPSAFVALAALPRTPHGKLDRAALPAPGAADGGPDDAPRGPTEEVLAGIFAELLGAGRVGRGAGFFELGGHSLLAARAAARVREAFGVDLPIPALWDAPTVAQLA